MTHVNLPLVLGSSSPYRAEIMHELGYEFTIVSPTIDEKLIRDQDPENLVRKISLAKAEAIKKKLLVPSISITADQVIAFGDEIREKPTSEEEARHFFETYHLHPIETINGITVTNTKTGKQLTEVEKSVMLMKPFPKEVIDQLVNDKTTYTCAGGLHTETPLFHPYIKETTGKKDSLYGLPKELINKLLEAIQIEPWHEAVVLTGEQVGRTLSYPTTNFDASLLLGREEGVYAVLVQYQAKIYKGALYFGPDYLKTTPQKVLEIHIFDFSETIYGETVSFQLGKYIRPPLRIHDRDVMKLQIALDIQNISKYFLR